MHQRRWMAASVTLVTLALVAACNRTPKLVLPESPELVEPVVMRLIDEHVGRVSAAPESVEARGDLCLVYEANALWKEAAATAE